MDAEAVAKLEAIRQVLEARLTGKPKKKPKKLKSKKAIDREIERIYKVVGDRVQVPIMSLSKIFRAGHAAAAAGDDLEAAIKAAVAKYRVN
jgi:hypothetical protein